MAGAGQHDELRSWDLGGEPAAVVDRHAGVGVAVPEAGRRLDVLESDVRRSRPHGEVLDHPGGPVAGAFLEQLDDSRAKALVEDRAVGLAPQVAIELRAELVGPPARLAHRLADEDAREPWGVATEGSHRFVRRSKPLAVAGHLARRDAAD